MTDNSAKVAIEGDGEGLRTGENGPAPSPARDAVRPGRDGGRVGDEPRRRRGAARQAGFGDGIERAVCQARGHVPPPTFPVQHRTGVATLRTIVVGRRDGAMLLCDGCHEGPHRWPGGEPVEA